MAVYKIFPSQDATLYSAFPSQNTGLDEILEVAVQNQFASVNGSTINYSTEDIRRALIMFSNTDLTKIKQFTTGSWQAKLRLFLANANNLNTNYNLEIHQVSQSWDMGTGKFVDNPVTTNGVCWNSTSSYVGANTSWNTPSYYTVPGGGSWTSTFTTQSFIYTSEKDLNADVTLIVDSWFSASVPNAGFLVKHSSSIENNSGSYIGLSFFSTDTHTIYPPVLEMKWDDSSYITGSLDVINNSNFIIKVNNNVDKFKYGTEKYRIQLTARDKFPTRIFTTASLYTVNKALTQNSYWAIQDIKTEDIVIDFDTTYTKISCDGSYSYFDLYMNGLEPERYYKVLVKTQLPTYEFIEKHIDKKGTN